MKRTKSMIILGVLALVIMSFSGVYANDFDAELDDNLDDAFKMGLYYDGKTAWCTYNGSTKDFWTGYIEETGTSDWMDCGPVYCFYGYSDREPYIGCNTKPEYNEDLKTSYCTDFSSNMPNCSLEY